MTEGFNKKEVYMILKKPSRKDSTLRERIAECAGCSPAHSCSDRCMERCEGKGESVQADCGSDPKGISPTVPIE